MKKRISAGLILVSLVSVLALAPHFPTPAQGVDHGCSICGHPPRHPWHKRSCRYYGLGLNQGGGGSGGGAMLSASDQAMLNAMQTMAPILQDFISKAIWGDPAEEARRAEERRIRQIIEAEEARRRAEEEARRREELHRRIMGSLKFTTIEDLRLKGFDGDGKGLGLKGLEEESSGELEYKSLEDDLKPRGSKLFGLGGGDGSGGASRPHGDPMVVDLRHLRRGVYMAQAAKNAPPEEADRILNEAVAVARGEVAFQGDPPADAVPAVSEKGLIEFQKANAAYRRANDSRLKETEAFNQARLRREMAQEALRKRREEAEAALGRGAPEDAAARMRELFEALRAEEESWRNAWAAWSAAQSRAAFEKAMLLEALRSSTKPEPSPLAESLRREREALEPTLAERARHEALKVYAREFAREADDFVRSSYAEVRDPVQQARLERLARRIQNLSPYPDEELRVRIIGDPLDPAEESGWEDNAAATSNTIYVGKNLLSLPDGQLLVIMGHETAHVQRDHYAEGLLMHKKENVRERIHDFLHPEDRKIPEENREFIRHAVRRARLHDFDYETESEADRLGVAMGLATGGVKPEDIRGTFEWMKKREEAHPVTRPGGAPLTEADKKLLEMMRDHPRPKDRFEDLKKRYGDPLGELK